MNLHICYLCFVICAEVLMKIIYPPRFCLVGPLSTSTPTHDDDDGNLDEELRLLALRAKDGAGNSFR